MIKPRPRFQSEGKQTNSTKPPNSKSQANRKVGNAPEAKPYLDMGVKHFCIGTDVSILFDWFKQNGRAMRETLGVPLPDTSPEAAKPGYSG